MKGPSKWKKKTRSRVGASRPPGETYKTYKTYKNLYFQNWTYIFFEGPIKPIKTYIFS
jgi:hypothetical protein